MEGEGRQHRGKRLALALLAAAFAMAALVAGAPAAEDVPEASTSGSGGIATQSLGTHYEETEITDLQARDDGGLILQRDDQVEAYLADGAPDPAVPPRAVSQYRGVFPLASGKSLVLEKSGLTRVNPDGSVDASFGGSGTIKPPVEPRAVAELPSGKILLVRAEIGGTHTRLAWASIGLLNPDGSIERGLGSRGVLTVSLPAAEENSYVPEIALTGDGGALVIGGGFLLELRADGRPNPSFGSHGLVSELPRLAGGRVLADGSIEAVGYADEDLAMLRYTAAGAPDTAFGADGIRRFDLGGEELARVASWAADGSVIIGGSARVPGSCPGSGDCEEEPILAAFDPAGNLDPGFGMGGVLRLSALTGEPDWYPGGGVTALARRPDGSIVAAGSGPPERTVAYLALVSPTGALLSSFGDGGIVRLRRPVPASQKVVGLAPLTSGKLLAAGTTDVGIEDAPILIRYGADGSLDRTFGDGSGYVTAGDSRFATGFAVNSSGQALIGVYKYPHSQLLLRSAADGAPVRSFGSDGVVQLPGHSWIEALGFAADGGAIVVGTYDRDDIAEPGMVLRFRPSGNPDSGFGHGGRVALRVPGGGTVKARALATGPGGRILVGGLADHRFAITRLLPDGRPDPRFGVGGWSLTKVGGGARSVTISRAGSRLYLAGAVHHDERPRVVLMRFREDGRLDRGFGRHGRLTATISKPARPKAIVPSRHGVLVVLSGGVRPLLSFDRDGEVRRRSPVGHPQVVDNVRATVVGGHLALGWNEFSRAVGRDVYHLARRPLNAP